MAPALQIVRAANQVNDNDSIGQTFSSVSAGTDTIAQTNAVIRENERMRQELKEINRITRRQRAKGKHAMKRHVKMSAEDLLHLKDYLFSLPPIQQNNQPHELKFPFNLRLNAWFWNILFHDPEPIKSDPSRSGTQQFFWL